MMDCFINHGFDVVRRESPDKEEVFGCAPF